MPDNPQPAKTQGFFLPDSHLLAIAGRDAVKFAHAQFMSDVAALAPGHWHWSGWLTPKGRVIALFALLKLDDETLWLLLPDFDAGEFAVQLQRYVFRSKVELQPRDDLHANGAFAKPALAKGAAFAIEDGTVELDMGGDGGPRTLRINAQPAADDPAAQAKWLAFDLAHGLPHLPQSQREHWTPQQLSLERLRAFSVKKGCYPGQEIVARTHFLGQAKRGLVLFECDAPVSPGDELVNGEHRAVGGIVSAADALALAILPLERDDSPLTANGGILRKRMLRGGLER
jgi:folate-binding protein YgfZ